MSCYGSEKSPIRVFVREESIVPLIEVGTIPSTGIIGNSMGGISRTNCEEDAVKKILNSQTIKYISNLLASKNIPFNEKVTEKNIRAFFNKGTFAVIINTNPNSDKNDLSNDIKLLYRLRSFNSVQKGELLLEGKTVLYQYYDPNTMLVSNYTYAPKQPPLNFNLASKGGKSKRGKSKHRKNAKRSNKRRKTSNRRKSVKRY